MLETLAAPIVLPVSLATAKQWLRETSTDWDADITFLLKAAFERAEKITHNAIVYRPVREQFDLFAPEMELAGYPVTGVKSITYLDTAGALQTLPAANYNVDITRGQTRIRPAYATYFPPTRPVMNSAKVTYDIGLLQPITAVDTVGFTLTAPGSNRFAGDIAQLSTDGGAMPGGLTAGTPYYVVNPAGDTFQVSLTSGGAPIALSAGFVAPVFLGIMPNDFTQAIRLMVGAWSNFNEDVVAVNVKELPAHGAEQLLQAYMPRGF